MAALFVRADLSPPKSADVLKNGESGSIVHLDSRAATAPIAARAGKSRAPTIPTVSGISMTCSPSAGDRPLSDYRRALSPKGTLVMVGSAGSTSGHLYLRGFGRWLRALVLSAFGRHKLRALLQTRSKEDPVGLKEFLEAGQVTPVMGAHFPLSEVPEASRQFEQGHTRGKVVITV